MKNSEFIYLDQEGYEVYKESIENLLVNLGRVEEKMNILKQNNYVQEEYNELLSLKEEIKLKIAKKKNDLSKIKIISNTNSNEDVVNIGDIVKIKTYYAKDEIEEEIYKLVSLESNVSNGIEEISINSPKGKILHNSKIGETKYFSLGKDKIRVDILEKIDVKALKKIL